MPAKKPSPKRRSACPLNASVEMLGDRWSLLILRDMMLRGFRTYKQFLGSYEGIATNILAESSPRNETFQTGESCFTCLQRKELLLHRFSRKWCCGQPGTRIPPIKRLSGKCKRTRSNSWLKSEDAGPKTPFIQLVTKSAGTPRRAFA